MPKRDTRLLAFFFFLLASNAASQSPPPGIFPLDQLRPGMIGTASTVIAGDELRTIEVEILGVLPDGIGPQVPMILGRLRGRDGEWNGVAAGMSGSPVTIDGKLVGALSYSIGQFPKEPVCGITPIATMLALENYPGGALPWRETKSNGATLAPLPMTLSFQGFSPSTVAQLPAVLQELGVTQAVTAVLAASGEPPKSPESFAPGRAIAALLTWGDTKIGATGTITYNDGKRILAFGHPFMASGRTSIPLAPAEIIWTVPSLANSFKIARIGAPVGVWQQDRLTAIAGHLGDVPAGVPVTLTVQRAGRPELRQHSYVIRDPYFTSVLAAVVMRGTLIEDLGAERDAALTLKAVVTLAGGRQVPITAVGPGGLTGSADGALANELQQKLQALSRAPIELPEIESIDLRVSSLEPDGVWSIDAARPDRLALHAGEAVQVRVALEGTRGQLRHEALQLRVPPESPPGNYTVLVGSARSVGGETGSQWEARRRTARTVDAYLSALGAAPPETELAAVLLSPSEGLIAAGQNYPSLPSSAQLLIRGRVGGGGDLYRTRWREWDRATISLDRQIDGLARLTIEVLP